MTAILNYILAMLPYMILAAPIHCIFRIFLLRKRRSELRWLREISLLLFVLFLAGLASQTVLPRIEWGANGPGIVQNGVHTTNLIPLKVLFETWEQLEQGRFNYFLINFLGNVVMFIPIGLFPRLLWNVSRRKGLLIGFCTSLFIEVCQLFLTRGTDVDDLLLNTLGTFLGILLYNLLHKTCPNFINRFRIQ